ncbi:MAG TPA: glycosyltransferase family 4 protein [Pyrinomonadaceae bacterium]|nr:glycosyltransferase family 4 protein [Pyrinomonadaceae bacterium]
MTQRPLRVAFIQPFLFRYARGIERYTFNLANEFARRGLETDLLTWNWPEVLHIDELDKRVSIWRFPTSRYFAAPAMVPFYVRHLLRHRYDFVWIAFAGYGEAEALMLSGKQEFGIVFHYPLAQVPHRYREFKRYGLAGRAAEIVSVSKHVAKGVREFFGRESAVVHHGVDAERFKPDEENRRATRKELRVGEAPLLMTVAALEERKGVQWVIRALPQIRQRFPNVIYCVAGEGNYRPALEKLACDLGVNSHLRFLGEQEDVTPFYQAADLTLILSRGEASSLTALESLACGVPVIAARHPPFDELISEEYGVLVDEEDADAVASAAGKLLADSGQRAVMGQHGRSVVKDNFSWELAADEYIKLMEGAVKPLCNSAVWET